MSVTDANSPQIAAAVSGSRSRSGASGGLVWTLLSRVDSFVDISVDHVCVWSNRAVISQTLGQRHALSGGTLCISRPPSARCGGAIARAVTAHKTRGPDLRGGAFVVISSKPY